MLIYSVSKPDRRVVGKIALDGSKSISNRLLIIKALCEESFQIDRLSTSNDTQTLVRLLAQKEETIFDAGAAGTTFRFMTAYLALQAGTQILTGSERMKQRPVGKLVTALRQLGCQIDYMENEGYPPLKIHSPLALDVQNLSIAADTSSQYITALLLIAPTLPHGLNLTLEGQIVSLPYIEMTLALMAHFGVTHTWDGQTIRIAPQKYKGRDITVEADWSAASYYYALGAFADELDLTLEGLFENSLQGDAVITEMATQLGLKTTYTEGGLHLSKSGTAPTPLFEWDFVTCPDIAQTLAVICGGLGVQGLFTGLETLFIKETDRVAALKAELAKGGVSFVKLPKRFAQKSDKQYFMVEGKLNFETTPQYPTYEDHRMAMAFAPIALLHPVRVEEPAVVGKSYPKFWDDLKTLGFDITPA